MTESPQARRRRPHPALGSRIAATGLGLTATFGLVAAMGAASGAAPDGASPTPTPSPRTVVVVHRTAPASPPPLTVATGSVVPTALTARPVLRAAPPPAAGTPTARTNGSR